MCIPVPEFPNMIKQANEGPVGHHICSRSEVLSKTAVRGVRVQAGLARNIDQENSHVLMLFGGHAGHANQHHLLFRQVNKKGLKTVALGFCLAWFGVLKTVPL